VGVLTFGKYALAFAKLTIWLITTVEKRTIDSISANAVLFITAPNNNTLNFDKGVFVRVF
jgi:hypothetical protein